MSIADGNEPGFDLMLEVGKVGERSVHDLLHLPGRKVEVKTDLKAWETGNVWVETSRQTPSGWAPSGISTTTAEAWAFVVAPGVTILVETERLWESLKFGRDSLNGSRATPAMGKAVPIKALMLRPPVESKA